LSIEKIEIKSNKTLVKPETRKASVLVTKENYHEFNETLIEK